MADSRPIAPPSALRVRAKAFLVRKGISDAEAERVLAECQQSEDGDETEAVFFSKTSSSLHDK